MQRGPTCGPGQAWMEADHRCPSKRIKQRISNLIPKQGFHVSSRAPWWIDVNNLNNYTIYSAIATLGNCEQLQNVNIVVSQEVCDWLD